MDAMEVLDKYGFASACVVALGGFVGAVVWWTLKSKDGSDKRLLDLSVKTIEKVGDNIEKQTGHMQLLTESTRRLEQQGEHHGRKLDEHSDHLEEIRRSLGARQA